MYCNKCGGLISEDSRYCKHCGALQAEENKDESMEQQDSKLKLLDKMGEIASDLGNIVVEQVGNELGKASKKGVDIALKQVKLKEKTPLEKIKDKVKKHSKSSKMKKHSKSKRK